MLVCSWNRPTCTRTLGFVIVRQLSFQVETGRREIRKRADALVDIGHAEALRHARKHGEILVEAMLDAEMESAVVLGRVERRDLGAVGKQKPKKQDEPPGALASKLSRAVR